jgi:hypothetical protein
VEALPRSNEESTGYMQEVTGENEEKAMTKEESARKEVRYEYRVRWLPLLDFMIRLPFIACLGGILRVTGFLRRKSDKFWKKKKDSDHLEPKKPPYPYNTCRMKAQNLPYNAGTAKIKAGSINVVDMSELLEERAKNKEEKGEKDDEC